MVRALDGLIAALPDNYESVRVSARLFPCCEMMQEAFAEDSRILFGFLDFLREAV